MNTQQNPIPQTEIEWLASVLDAMKKQGLKLSILIFQGVQNNGDEVKSIVVAGRPLNQFFHRMNMPPDLATQMMKEITEMAFKIDSETVSAESSIMNTPKISFRKDN